MSQHPVYITSVGAFLPGAPVDNDHMEQVLGLVGGKQSRLRKRILAQNGIVSRHYALDADGRSTHLNEELAANAVHDALKRRGLPLDKLEMLATGTTQPDLPVPGFASMVHGRLGGKPLEVLSAAGVCCSGMAAFLGAFRAVQSGQRRNAAAVGSEHVSRTLKASRFEMESDAGEDELGFRAFDADFLRWMLSDGAGAVLLENKPAPSGLSLRVEWVELVSHAGELPTCMSCGLVDKDHPKAGNSWLDFPTIAQADKAGVMKVRQDTRLLPNIVKLGVEEYLRLVQREAIRTDEIDHVLCHFSSKFFEGEVMKMLEDAKVVVPRERWFTNLYSKGNTGAASIFVMLEEAFNAGRFKKGETVLLMVPESGRFSVAFAKLKVVDSEDAGAFATGSSSSAAAPERGRWSASTVSQRTPLAKSGVDVEQAIDQSPLGRDFLDDADALQRKVGVELALVWADFERMLRAVPLMKRLDDGTVTLEDYQRLLINLRQQVMEGARWIARAASNISIELFPLRSLFLTHAGEEHKDFQMIERDYVAVGGAFEDIIAQPKNVGSEALNAFMFHQSSQPDPLDLLGAMFIIEGLGRRKASVWAEQLQQHLGLKPQQTSFLTYHGKNDDGHLGKLKDVVKSGAVDEKVAARVVKTAKVVARLYALQLEEIDHV